MKTGRYLLLLIACLLYAASASARNPVVAIIIDDLGYRSVDDSKALALPGPLVYAVLPHSPGAREVIRTVNRRGDELVLHLPMQSAGRSVLASPGTLTRTMDWITFIRTLQNNLAAVPGIVAVNNHEGSDLTTDYQRMTWLMQELSRHPGIAFIDSRTTHHTVALKAAHATGLQATRRDVFLDYAPGKIDEQFRQLISKARQQGSALAIAHPYTETIEYLRQNLGELKKNGIDLVPVSQLIKMRQWDRKIAGGDHGKGVSAASGRM